MSNFVNNGTSSGCGINAWSRLRNIKEKIDFSSSQVLDLEYNLIFFISHPDKIDTSPIKENNQQKNKNSDIFSTEDISNILTKLSIARSEKLDLQKDEYFWSTVIEEIKKESFFENNT